MTILVTLVGALLALLGLGVMIVPSTLKKTLWSLMESDRFHLIAILRIVLGVLLILAAGQTRSPTLVFIVGGLMILAGILIPVMGKARIQALAGWWMNKSDNILRLWGLMAFLLGIALVGAGL
jgi:hypothetical protein